MTVEEARQIKEYLNEIIVENSNKNLAPDFINELKVIFNSEERKDLSEIDQVNQVLSLLRIHAFPVNQKDVINLYESFSKLLGESIESIAFLDPVTERVIRLNDVPDFKEEELQLRGILDLVSPSFENEFDSFAVNNNARNNKPKP